MAATRATAEVAINTKSGLSADLPDFRDYRGMVMAATKARQAQRRNGHVDRNLPHPGIAKSGIKFRAVTMTSKQLAPSPSSPAPAPAMPPARELKMRKPPPKVRAAIEAPQIYMQFDRPIQGRKKRTQPCGY
jgi:hypothetical protein